MMITTVTLNASIDKAYYLNKPLEKGTIARVNTVKNSAGGKGLNVARVIHLYNHPVMATGFIGGYNGQYLSSLLDQDKIKYSFFNVSGETRCCINILDKNNLSTELLEPGMNVTSSELNAYRHKLNELVSNSNVVVFSGSLPQGVPADYYYKLIKDLKFLDKKVILDTSGEALKKGIYAQPTLVKPNIDEIEQLFNIKITSKNELVKYMKEISSFGVEYVVVSLGAEGAMLLYENTVFLGKPPKIRAINTVGCGDSMVAAFAIGLDKDYKATDLLRLAVAFGAANALSTKTGYFEQDDLEEMMKKTVIQEWK